MLAKQPSKPDNPWRSWANLPVAPKPPAPASEHVPGKEKVWADGSYRAFSGTIRFIGICIKQSHLLTGKTSDRVKAAGRCNG